MEKIILLSKFFEVTTDYLLKGIEPVGQKEKKNDITFICNTVAAALNLLGIIIAVFIWYSVQEIGAVIAGLVFIILGTMVHVIGLSQSTGEQKISARYRFWKVNIWTVLFLPLSVIWNTLTVLIPAPYPLLFENMYYQFIVFWIVYLFVCVIVTRICIKNEGR